MTFIDTTRTFNQPAPGSYPRVGMICWSLLDHQVEFSRLN